MANIAVLLVMGVVVWYLVRAVRRSRGIVARRGMSIGADLGTMADKPRVRVRTVTELGPNRVRIVLTPDGDAQDEDAPDGSPDIDLVVSLGQDEFGFDLLHEWQRSASPLALVIPPGSRLVRLRSVDDLQPLLLRRADDA